MTQTELKEWIVLYFNTLQDPDFYARNIFNADNKDMQARFCKHFKKMIKEIKQVNYQFTIWDVEAENGHR